MRLLGEVTYRFCLNGAEGVCVSDTRGGGLEVCVSGTYYYGEPYDYDMVNRGATCGIVSTVGCEY